MQVLSPVANITTTSSVTTNGETILPIVLAEILELQETQKPGILLLDTRAQLSLWTSVTEELGLKGKTINIAIAKVGGEEEMTTKMYRVQVQSLESQMIHKIAAVGIPCISNDICEIKLNDIAKVFGFGKSEEEKVWLTS